MSGRYLEGVWKVSGRCLEGVWKVSEMCLKGVKLSFWGEISFWDNIFWSKNFRVNILGSNLGMKLFGGSKFLAVKKIWGVKFFG